MNHRHVLLVLVIPPTLMIPQREHRRERRRPSDASVLSVKLLRSNRPGKQKQINNATLSNPMRPLPPLRTFVNVHKHLARVVEKHATNRICERSEREREERKEVVGVQVVREGRVERVCQVERVGTG